MQIRRKKVCAYGRVSTDDEEQITSYNSQIKYYTEKNWQGKSEKEALW